ncbi:hypothetical protein [Endozoicomonas ascidiicola]|uniref:hypothetical protein n=1 Tax=Endozoicomonas ascidiicola TaxID=1698521 RepID=UPI0012FA5FC3|nr:hypothetical protein [Endozoicomonas ascidiicola]
MFIFRKVLWSVVLVLLAHTGAVCAAFNPPDPDNTSSTGTFDITFYNETQILLYGLKDVVFHSTSATAAPSEVEAGFTPFCVAETIGGKSSANQYEISLASSNDFNLKNAADVVSIPYTLTVMNGGTAIRDGVWGGGKNPSGFFSTEKLPADVAIGGTYTCDSSLTVNRSIKVDVTGSTPVAAGVYNDTVTVIVTPI